MMYRQACVQVFVIIFWTMSDGSRRYWRKTRISSSDFLSRNII